MVLQLNIYKNNILLIKKPYFVHQMSIARKIRLIKHRFLDIRGASLVGATLGSVGPVGIKIEAG